MISEPTVPSAVAAAPRITPAGLEGLQPEPPVPTAGLSLQQLVPAQELHAEFLGLGIPSAISAAEGIASARPAPRARGLPPDVGRG